jgi:GDP-4-dehydro-6-deoxy-D-mannose reductase
MMTERAAMYSVPKDCGDLFPRMNLSSNIFCEKLLVTGSRGFVGRHFRSAYGGDHLEDEDGVVDLRDCSRINAVVSSLRPQAVLHLAAQSSVADSFSDPLSTITINFLGTLNLLQALSAIRFQGVFLYVGSADTYGQVLEHHLPTKETQPLRPRSPYAVSKVAAEALCYQWSQTHRFRIVMARPFNQIGPGQDIRFAIPSFAAQIAAIRHKAKPPVLITGDLDVSRDFTDVRDTIRAYRALLEGGSNGEIYNICSGREHSLRSLVEGLLSIAGVVAELTTDPGRVRSNEQKRMMGDPSKIYNQLGWAPEIPMTTTLSDIYCDFERT